MKDKKIRLLKLLSKALLVVALIASSFVVANADAQIGTDISKTKFEPLTLDLNTGITTLPVFNGGIADVPDELYMGNGVYSVYYKNGLNYTPENKTLSVEVTAQKTYDPNGLARVYYHNKRLRVGWKPDSYGTKVTWTVRFIDETTGNDYPVHVLFGFEDPDESHIKFTDANGYNIYYRDADPAADAIAAGVTGTAATNFVKTNEGLFRLKPGTSEIIDTATYHQDPGGFGTGEDTNAIFYVELIGKSSFTFETDTIIGGALGLPYFWSIKHEIAYDPNKESINSTPTPASMDNSIAKIGSNTLSKNLFEADGYRWVGWNTKKNNTGTGYVDEDNLVLDASEFGEEVVVKTLYAQWEPIKYQIEYKPNEEYVNGQLKTHKVTEEMENQEVTVGTYQTNPNKFQSVHYNFVGWNTEPDGSGTSYADPSDYVVTPEAVKGKEDNAIVGTLYAQWEPIKYSVQYDPNGGVGEMAPQKDLEYDVDYNLTKNTYTREGYDWVGWNTAADRSADPYTDEQGFKNLTEEDGGIVTMYAQWEPWKYFVKYEPNGGVGEMKTQTFVYTDDKMNSKENQFVRDGYEFIGFEFENKGAKYIITSTKDFNDMLKELGPNSSITLVAQWRKLPDPIVKYYALPVTGVEDYR